MRGSFVSILPEGRRTGELFPRRVNHGYVPRNRGGFGRGVGHQEANVEFPVERAGQFESADAHAGHLGSDRLRGQDNDTAQRRPRIRSRRRWSLQVRDT